MPTSIFLLVCSNSNYYYYIYDKNYLHCILFKLSGSRLWLIVKKAQTSITMHIESLGCSNSSKIYIKCANRLGVIVKHYFHIPNPSLYTSSFMFHFAGMLSQLCFMDKLFMLHGMVVYTIIPNLLFYCPPLRPLWNHTTINFVLDVDRLLRIILSLRYFFHYKIDRMNTARTEGLFNPAVFTPVVVLNEIQLYKCR